MKIYLIRHGESEHNVDRFLMSHTHDSKFALTAKGQKQAELTGEFMKDKLNEKSIFYVSPYLRTIQTANAIYSKVPYSVPFYESPLIREWELGNLYDFNDRPPELKREFKAAGAFYFRYHHGESMADVYLRASLFYNTVVQRLEATNKYENLVVVSHAAFIEMVKGFLLNWTVERMTDFKPVENGSVTLLGEVNGDFHAEKIFVPEVDKVKN